MQMRKICFLHMRLNNMDIKNINARLGNLCWILRKTSEEALAHRKTKLELEHPQFIEQRPTSQLVDNDQMRCHVIQQKPEALDCVR